MARTCLPHGSAISTTWHLSAWLAATLTTWTTAEKLYTIFQLDDSTIGTPTQLNNARGAGAQKQKGAPSTLSRVGLAALGVPRVVNDFVLDYGNLKVSVSQSDLSQAYLGRGQRGLERIPAGLYAKHGVSQPQKSFRCNSR